MRLWTLLQSQSPFTKQCMICSMKSHRKWSGRQVMSSWCTSTRIRSTDGRTSRPWTVDKYRDSEIDCIQVDHYNIIHKRDQCVATGLVSIHHGLTSKIRTSSHSMDCSCSHMDTLVNPITFVACAFVCATERETGIQRS